MTPSTRTSTAFAGGLASVFWLAITPFGGLADDELKAFPDAADGIVRHVLTLPAQDDESLFKVELIAGKTVETDAVNRYFFGGEISEQTIEGWGYTKYVVSELGPMAGTMIGVDPDAPKVERFITLGGGPKLVRYNSQLPLVVYAPEGVEVRYRIWATTEASEVMEEG